MTIHKFNSELARASTEALAVGLHFQHEIYGFAETVLKARAIRALEGVAARYPIYRSVRCAARRKVEEIFDDLALHSGFGASRLDATSLLLDGTEHQRRGRSIAASRPLFRDRSYTAPRAQRGGIALASADRG